ncbi:MAG: hypothetical protein WAV48_06715, partial [Candidatus Magasanikiibacteriota bacterium]
PIADSSISGRLNELLTLKWVTDQNPKRKCRIHPIMKKTWRLTRPLRAGEAEAMPLMFGMN